MSNSENLPPKRRKLKMWQWAVLIFVVFPIILAIFVGGSSSTTSEPTPTSEVTEEEVTEEEVTEEAQPQPIFSSEITRWEPLNPASGRAVFTIRNTGEVTGSPGSCYIKVQDESGQYKGESFVIIENEIKPGAKWMDKAIIKVTNEGAFFATVGSIKCGK